MAQNWYALSASNDGNSVQIAYHIPIPSANNLVGINYQVAIINSGIGGRTILATGTGPGQITSADLALIQNGSLFEYVEQLAIDPSKTLPQLSALVNARFSALTASVQATLQKQLAYFGGVG
jgi:hypothetical protein